jgi:hypothetical protein
MEHKFDVLLVSPAQGFPHSHPREQLLRLTIPAERVPEQLYLPTGQVWWVERQAARFWLRGYGCVEETTREVVLDGTVARVVWHLYSECAERLTMPGAPAPEQADVSVIVGVKARELQCPIWVKEISSGVTAELERRRSLLAETTTSYELARRHFARLSRETGLSDQLCFVAQDLSKAWQFAHMNFARAELVGLEGWDAYDIAAAALAGYRTLPKNWNVNSETRTDWTTQRGKTFQPLDPTQIGVVEQSWRRGGLSSSMDELERSDRRHQQVLKSLATNLLTYGLKPFESRFVDLRVLADAQEVFFEIKTATADNFLHQIRLALGQLLEYRYRYQEQAGDKSIKLVAVLEQSGTEADQRFAREFLAESAIELMTWVPEENHFVGLGRILQGANLQRPIA